MLRKAYHNFIMDIVIIIVPFTASKGTVLDAVPCEAARRLSRDQIFISPNIPESTLV